LLFFSDYLLRATAHADSLFHRATIAGAATVN